MNTEELGHDVEDAYDQDQMSISVVIPVLEEADHINGIIQHLRDQDGGENCQIIVVDGETNGGSINEITDIKVVTAISDAGRAKQMNAGAQLATGDVIIFLHADTKLPEGAFAKVARVMEDEDVAAGAFSLGFDSENKLMRFIGLCGNIRNRMTRIPYGDQAIFIWRQYFERIGGFKPMPIMEDVEFMRRIKKRRDGIEILKDKVTTSSRRYEKDGIIRRALKNFLLLMLYHLGVSPYRLAELYHGKAKRKHGRQR